MTQSQKMMQTPHQRLVTRLFLTPQITQGLSILQLGVPQLDTYLKSMAVNNPLIKIKHSTRKSLPIDPDWDIISAETLNQHLMSQNRLLKISPVKQRAVTVLINRLSQSGYLQESLSQISLQTQISEKKLVEALRILQSMDPIGVGARNLCECLLLQARVKDGFDNVALEILQADQLELLSQPRNWPLLSHSKPRLQQALSSIQMLNPFPGAQFSSASDVPYLIPDLYLKRTASGLVIKTASDLLPRIVFDDTYYQQLLTVADEETKKYLDVQVEQYQMIQSSLNRREKTLWLIGKYIATHQVQYFEQLTLKSLKPMTLQKCAFDLGYATSTISRAVQDKYLQVDNRIIPLRTFFQRQVNCKDTQIQIMDLISELIAHEDIRVPLSDKQITQILSESGHPIARRTVSKYRSQAGFATHYLRHK